MNRHPYQPKERQPMTERISYFFNHIVVAIVILWVIGVLLYGPMI